MTSLGNYTGPYVSDGKFQTSVEFGGAPALNELDALSRLHDSAYAKWQDRAHREAADKIYYDQASKLPGNLPKIAANAVQYGNYAANSAEQLAKGVLTYGPLGGALGFGISRLAEMNKRLNGTYGVKEMKEVHDYFNSDPGLTGETRGIGVLTKDPGPRIRSEKPPVRPAPVSGKFVIPVVDERPVQYQPVVDKASNRVVNPVLAPQRQGVVHDDHIQLPSGNWIRRRKRKQVVPLLEPIEPRHKLADVAEAAKLENIRIPEGSVKVYNGYDPTWHVNPLRRRNRVKPVLKQ